MVLEVDHCLPEGDVGNGRPHVESAGFGPEVVATRLQQLEKTLGGRAQAAGLLCRELEELRREAAALRQQLSTLKASDPNSPEIHSPVKRHPLRGGGSVSSLFTENGDTNNIQAGQGGSGRVSVHSDPSSVEQKSPRGDAAPQTSPPIVMQRGASTHSPGSGLMALVPKAFTPLMRQGTGMSSGVYSSEGETPGAANGLLSWNTDYWSGGDLRSGTGFKKARRLDSRTFESAEAIKDKILDKLTKDPEPGDPFYKETGLFAAIARTNTFEMVSLAVVVLSSLWISVDIDYNKAEFLYEAPTLFQVAAHFFCVFFVLELLIRFLAAKSTWSVCKDYSFMFDTMLVMLVVFETWAVPLVMAVTGDAYGNGDMRVLAVFRTVRLLRILRLGRVLRELPELLVIVRGVMMSFRALATVSALLAIIIYLAALVFRVMMEGTELGNDRFGSCLAAMGTLLLEGTLSGARGGELMREAYEESAVFAFALLAFVLLANVTMMGVLGGALVQTIRTVAEVEQEESQVRAIAIQLEGVWEHILDHRMNIHDCDNVSTGSQRHTMTITEADLNCFLRLDDEAMKLLNDVGVDLDGLLNVSSFIFQQNAGQLRKQQFKKMLLDLRGKMQAKVKDHVETRKFVHASLQEFGQQLTKDVVSDVVSELLSVIKGSRRVTPTLSAESLSNGMVRCHSSKSKESKESKASANGCGESRIDVNGSAEAHAETPLTAQGFEVPFAATMTAGGEEGETIHMTPL
eukprot:TRINITY_DN44645_c0_g1_i1.p1 TRINITY_DN44645_c0_g1~~TRINITY_DN44645_c0_g1_i1.p1  ORF type:complete len:744 (-),score=192.31 TRINITY_DN44645_c0_g1_i1:185-2416(-)